MSDNINYKELKIFINKHENYFDKNLNSALKVIENAEKNKSTAKPINILNRIEDLNIKRGDAKFNSEVHSELRKLLGLDKKTPPALPKRSKRIIEPDQADINYDGLIDMLERKSWTDLCPEETLAEIKKFVKNEKSKNVYDGVHLYYKILNMVYEKKQSRDDTLCKTFELYLKNMTGCEDSEISKYANLLKNHA